MIDIEAGKRSSRPATGSIDFTSLQHPTSASSFPARTSGPGILHTSTFTCSTSPPAVATNSAPSRSGSRAQARALERNLIGSPSLFFALAALRSDCARESLHRTGVSSTNSVQSQVSQTRRGGGVLRGLEEVARIGRSRHFFCFGRFVWVGIWRTRGWVPSAPRLCVSDGLRLQGRGARWRGKVGRRWCLERVPALVGWRGVDRMNVSGSRGDCTTWVMALANSLKTCGDCCAMRDLSHMRMIGRETPDPDDSRLRCCAPLRHVCRAQGGQVS